MLLSKSTALAYKDRAEQNHNNKTLLAVTAKSHVNCHGRWQARTRPMGVRYSVVDGVASEPRRRQPAAGVSNPAPPALPARRRLEPSPTPGGDGTPGLAAGAPATAGALLKGLLGTSGGVYPGEGAPAGSPAYPCCGGLAGAGSASEL